MSMFNRFAFLSSLLFWITVQASTVEIKEAMVVSYAGTVEIFSVATDSSLKDNTFVIFEGTKYFSRRVQSGTKVKPGDILRSGSDGKMKIIYSNGDVFIIGPATAFKVPQKLEKGIAAEVSSEILYGKTRAMINKKGPLSGLKIHTKTAVAGVRGTDLYVSFNPLNSTSQVHVLRGEVEVQALKPASDAASEAPAPQTTQKPVIVKTGQKATLETLNEKSETVAPIAKVLVSTQQDLKNILKTTETPAPEFKELKAEEKKEITELLKASQEQIIEDIRTTTPDVYKSLQGKKVDSIEAISKVVVETLEKSAPKGSSKPKMSDFNGEEDVYKKYFKPVGQ